MPWPLKRSEPVVKYRKKDQRNKKKKKSNIGKELVGFFGQRKIK